jgi:hypothetical protein
VHLVLSDVEDRIKQDAALAPPNPQPAPPPPPSVSIVPKPPATSPVVPEPAPFDAAGIAAAIAGELAAVDQQKRKK